VNAAAPFYFGYLSSCDGLTKEHLCCTFIA
jgi:hypothetical protein